ncbi:hypothetical protein GVN16_18315 [Emticicia sp. CRIBPO]|uniref:hypothetical protein n=1 Tax=Emticicia sp. CRIBPO TaxID=2683258 RepID=UPI0014127DC8|nr:hypothetical protein [Emticicia sp. CRIBPO]NBA87730.1 hypothetical protein [Emticicia sp. CRIBPO]
MKHFIKKPLYSLIGIVSVLIPAFRCSEEPREAEHYSIASSDYGILAEKSLDLMSSLDIDNWGSMMSDSVVYYFPDETQTKLVGKAEVLSWWKNYVSTSGLKSMTIENASYLPVSLDNNLGTKELPGVQVIAYFSNKMVYREHTSSIRMNFVIHFDKEKLIDGYYTYYDRSDIMPEVKHL